MSTDDETFPIPITALHFSSAENNYGVFN